MTFINEFLWLPTCVGTSYVSYSPTLAQKILLC
jgi:hypothetical protein